MVEVKRERESDKDREERLLLSFKLSSYVYEIIFSHSCARARARNIPLSSCPDA